MDQAKFIELQHQMRQNNEEVVNFLEDFGSWKETVEMKNAKLEGPTKLNNELPAIRNSLLRKNRKKPSKKTQPVKPKTERLKGSDYRAWDKFDVDKALVDSEEEEETAKENGQKSPSSSSETDEEMENQRRLNLAKEARELGNLRFKEANYIDSIEHYTTTIRLTPEDPVPLINRAFAYLKLERYASAELDCSSALTLNPNCIKALFRRALARKYLNRKEEAIQDLEHVLRLERTNKASLKELAALRGISEPELHRQLFPDPKQSSATSQSPNQTISLRGDRKFRRVPISEVGSSLPSTHKSSRVEGPGGDLPIELQLKPVAAQPTQATQQIPSPRLACAPEPKSRDSMGSPIPLITLNPEGPSNWFQLERELRELKTGANSVLTPAAADYLCRIAPQRYLTVIGNNLETGNLVQFLRAFEMQLAVMSPSDLFARLTSLSKLPRFDVAWMLTSDTDRECFGQLMTRLEKDLPTAQLINLKQGFD